MGAESMLAYVYHGPNDLRLERMPLPALGAHDALLRVAAAGICGTDLRIAHGGHARYPTGTVRVPGHEVAGTIVAGGSQADLLIGRRVMVAPNFGCGRCRECRAGNNNLCREMEALGITMDGGCAEYMKVPGAAIAQGNLLPIDDTLEVEQAALAEPLATVLRGQSAVGLGAGDNVLIVGAGPIGILHLLLARQRGARRVLISQRQGPRAELAAHLGADRVVDPEREDLASAVAAETDGAGADVVIVAAPSADAQRQAVELAATRGRINFFGGLPRDQPTVPLDTNRVHYRELLVTGTTGCSTADCRRALDLLNQGCLRVDELINARYPLGAAAEAFAAAADRRRLKVVLAM